MKIKSIILATLIVGIVTGYFISNSNNEIKAGGGYDECLNAHSVEECESGVDKPQHDAPVQEDPKEPIDVYYRDDSVSPPQSCVE